MSLAHPGWIAKEENTMTVQGATQAAVFACGDSFTSGDGRVWWAPGQVIPWPARLKVPGFDGVSVTNVASRRAKCANVGWLVGPMGGWRPTAAVNP